MCIPFYRELADVLVGVERMKRSLSHVLWGLRLVERLTGQYALRAKGCFSKEEALIIRREYFGRIASVIRELDDDFRLLAEAKIKLSKLPDIDPRLPTVVVAAAPNVGKSTLVHKVSSAKPEIAPYPFTTKGLIVGHIEVTRAVRVQVVDTPGLLDRPLSERNQIELQAIVALKHIADVIIFLVDPTMHSGYPLDYQLRVLREIKDSFTGIPLLIAMNKIDIATEEERIRTKELLSRYGKVYEISAKKDIGLDELMKDAIEIAMKRKAIGGSDLALPPQ